MPSASDGHVRRFSRLAAARLEDAEWLMRARRYNAAVYLAGYVVECSLKALLLSVTPFPAREDQVTAFRGARAHNYDDLRVTYLTRGGAPIPKNMTRALAEVERWSTDLRYATKLIRFEQASKFIKAAADILAWAQGRLS